jgi:Phosphoesterase family
MAAQPPLTTKLRIVVFIQENKTTDYYFSSLAAWGADVRSGGVLLAAPPDHDQPHDRSAWVHYRIGDYPGLAVQLDNDAVIAYYSWLAKTYTFCDHHFGLGTNSTPGHMMAIGGQTPTLKNPPFGAGGPQWDIPSIFMHAQRAGLTWAAFPDAGGYPTKFYTELNPAAAKKNIHTSAGDFVTLAKAGKLPQLVYAWSPSGFDEHPPQKPDPQYITHGQRTVWERVDAVVQGGHWGDTVFILTWDDWGGYADHVVTPDSERVPDALHPNGFPVIGGSRLPLIMFGGAVMQGIDNTWHSHASIPKTIIDLLGLPAFGVPRVDHAPSLAGRVDASRARPAPPSLGAVINQPKAPLPTPKPVPPPPWTGPLAQPMPVLVANGGKTIPAPNDAVVHPNPPPAPVA